MKLLLKINGTTVVLNEADVNVVLDILHTSEKLVEKYVGAGKGDDGGNYRKTIEPLDTTADLSVSVLHDGVYAALKMAASQPT